MNLLFLGSPVNIVGVTAFTHRELLWFIFRGKGWCVTKEGKKNYAGYPGLTENI